MNGAEQITPPVLIVLARSGGSLKLLGAASVARIGDRICMSQTTLAARERLGIAANPKLQPPLAGSDDLRRAGSVA